ncbi:hypothetical protein PGB28_03915 [Primorskyibacter aestuariivivens]|uniref:COG4223 family protein n=1 Tax=Primorskyibacter aestuariivivens TaxID=1888912 RepID=UPI002301C13F|nr:hypothetical protein [Primorskyibacter aestuariivivens]MDA7427592.1 hypothetical protein [Primorskyibacter aestuariivivens]
MSDSKDPKSENVDDKANKDEVTETPEATVESDGADTSPEAPETDADTEASGETPEEVSDAEDTVEDAEIVPDGEPEGEIAPPEQSETEEAAAERAPDAAAPEAQTVVERRGGFGAMLFGGVAAAAVGFGAAQYESGDWPFGGDGGDTFRADVTAALAEQGETLEGLSASLQDRADATDTALKTLGDNLSATSGAIDETRETLAALTDRVGALESLPDQLAVLETRMTDLAKRPIEDNVSREAIKAYEDELERLRASMEEQRKAIEDTIAAEKAKIEKIAAEATEMEERALAEARLAAARSAMTRILSALDTGDAFGAALGELADNIDTPVPDALSAVAETGVATQATLREEFPDLARAALRAARDNAPAEEGESGIGSVLEKMFEVRSVEPREGDDADAVLSRAEAAVRGGDLQTALTEIEALPDVAKAELETWVAAANARFAALAAAQDIAQQLNR